MLEEALVRVGDCKLVVIDPIGSFLGPRLDVNRENEVRGVLAPIAKLAEKYGAAVLSDPITLLQPPRLVEPLMTKAKAAEILSCCPRTVDNLIAAGRLPVVKLGTAARIDPHDLRAFIDAAKRSKTAGT